MQKLCADIAQTICGWRFWIHLATMDVKGQYRRSFLGPIWLTLNTLVFIGAFSYIGARIFNTPVGEYILPFTIGQILFIFFSTSYNEVVYAYIASSSYIKQIPAPKLAFVFRVIARNVIIFMHSVPIIALVYIIFGDIRELDFLRALWGWGLALIFLLFSGATLALIAARYRDVPMIVSNITNLLYFITPIIWSADRLKGGEKYLLYVNPIYWLVEIIRAPLLGKRIPNEILVAYPIGLSVLIVLSAFLYYKFRKNIPYWV